MYHLEEELEPGDRAERGSLLGQCVCEGPTRPGAPGGLLA